MTVFAVRSDERAAVRALLIPNGLAVLRQWLRAVRPETWFVGMRRLEVGYALGSRESGWLESRDHRTLTWGVVPLQGTDENR